MWKARKGSMDLQFAIGWLHAEERLSGECLSEELTLFDSFSVIPLTIIPLTKRLASLASAHA
jgi:hypothetical protein